MQSETATAPLTEQHPLEKLAPPSEEEIKKKDQSWAENLVNFLNTFSCKTPLFPNDYGTIITISEDDTIETAFKKMVDHQIMSLPVIHEKTRKPLYVISMLHIVSLLTSKFSLDDFREGLWNKISSLFVDKSKNFFKTKISDIEGLVDYKLDMALIVEEHAPLWQAVSKMIDYGAHRVLVIDHFGDVQNIITQSRILQTFSTIVDTLPRNRFTVKELGLGTKDVISIRDNQTAYEAFKLMKDQKITGLPVIDKDGKLCGSISISDLKLIGYHTDYWNLLGKEVREYLKSIKDHSRAKIRSKALAQLQQENKNISIRCYEWQTLNFIIRHITYFGVHRLFIVDDLGKPIGVITLSDILKVVMNDEYVLKQNAKMRR